ncbi:MAG: hypothetical protein PHY34_03095 [Patescibacteria group bacterium]|nr:hypothetical protein [Patescibacteria group bacterium]MDD5716138.1 hypothetical protein [Patescibacteria group bacterium]
MNHVDFFRITSEGIESAIGTFIPEELKTTLFSPDYAVDFRPDIVVTLLEKVACRYGCDITHSLPQHNITELARQVGLVIVRFAQSHARQCQYCTEKVAALAILLRLMNTYVVKKVFNSIPREIPDRAYYFFLDTDDPDYVTDTSTESSGKSSIRDYVRQWDITGNNTVH